MTINPTVHCWESGEFHGAPGHTCILLSGHPSEHHWIRNDTIIDYFREGVILHD